MLSWINKTMYMVGYDFSLIDNNKKQITEIQKEIYIIYTSIGILRL